jgi:hypothetical protein
MVSIWSVIRFPIVRCGIAGQKQTDAIDHAKFSSRSHDAVIRVYDETGNVIGTHTQAGDFKEW